MPAPAPGPALAPCAPQTSGLITGDIRVNGFPKDQHTFARVAGYVEQTDGRCTGAAAGCSAGGPSLAEGPRPSHSASHPARNDSLLPPACCLPMDCTQMAQLPCPAAALMACLAWHALWLRGPAAVHMPQTTVAEACHFSARVRLPTSVEKGSREAFVEEVSQRGGRAVLHAEQHLLDHFPSRNARQRHLPASPGSAELAHDTCGRARLVPARLPCQPAQAMALVELDRLRHAHVGVPGVSGLSVEQRKRLTLAVRCRRPAGWRLLLPRRGVRLSLSSAGLPARLLRRRWSWCPTHQLCSWSEQGGARVGVLRVCACAPVCVVVMPRVCGWQGGAAGGRPGCRGVCVSDSRAWRPAVPATPCPTHLAHAPAASQPAGWMREPRGW